jgi:arylsulfatase A-like enzyme
LRRPRDRRPNIVYLMTDQQKASGCPVYGNPRVPSPFLQELARSRLVFKDAYAASPICTPSRTAVPEIRVVPGYRGFLGQ